MGIDGRARYLMQRVDAGITTFDLSVPPGYYYVVARRDGDPLRGAGATFELQCRSSCGGNAGNNTLEIVQVYSKQVVTNLTLGDWGAEDNLRTLFEIDVHGAPLTLHPAAERSVPIRHLPSPSTDLALQIQRPGLGYSLRLPASWSRITPPTNIDDDFYSNQQVASPVQMDANGVWLTVRSYLSSACPSVDWRYPTAKASVPMQDGHQEVFYFENPSGPLGGQPFAGYVFRGGWPGFGNCLAFIFTGASQAALESNLSEITAILTNARFYKPTT